MSLRLMLVSISFWLAISMISVISPSYVIRKFLKYLSLSFLGLMPENIFCWWSLIDISFSDLIPPGVSLSYNLGSLRPLMEIFPWNVSGSLLVCQTRSMLLNPWAPAMLLGWAILIFFSYPDMIFLFFISVPSLFPFLLFFFLPSIFSPWLFVVSFRCFQDVFVALFYLFLFSVPYLRLF